MGRTVEGGSYEAIYRVVAQIPEGRVATYGQVAVLAGLPGHARQVGYALHALPDELCLPWQRVINAKGEVSLRSPEGGPGREGYQRHLLEEEGVEFDLAGRIDLARFAWEPEAGRTRRASTRRTAAPRGRVGRWLREIEVLLPPLGARERADGAKAYLKSDLEFWGVDTPTLRRASRVFWTERGAPDRKDLLALIEALWQRSIHELRSFAMETLFLYRDLLLAEDLPLLESLLRRSGTWAYVDALAIQVAGPLILRYPKLRSVLDRWARDTDFWLRRSALLSLLQPLRAGVGDWERFTRYADPMLEESEFFIRKAIGWVLREVGKRRPKLVAEFVAPRLERIAGLTLREAVKFLPIRERSRLLATYASLRPAARRAPSSSRRSTIGARRKG